MSANIVDFSSSPVDFVSPDTPSKCKWAINTTEKSPHSEIHKVKPAIYSTILDHVGNTPLVRLNKIPAEYGIKCEILAKCEFFNPGGSLKDRIALRMIEDAEREGKIKPGGTLIEPTSGNTGIGIALAAAVKGYRCIIVMPQKMSTEKSDVLRALGAEVVRTPTAAAFDAPNSNFSVAQKLARKLPNSYILDQFKNAGNPLAHYDGTATEILEQCENRVDMIVAGAGTGGTIAGIGRKIKDVLPSCQVVAFDPVGSTLAPESTEPGFYEVEGIGYDFIPTVLDLSVVDRWEKTSDKESLLMAREIMSKEGLLCGGSSGSALVAALRAAKDLKEGQRCVVVLPDGVRNYMTKFLADKWMIERGYISPAAAKVEASPVVEKPWFWNLSVSSIAHGLGLVTISNDTKCADAIALMKQRGYDQLPVVDTSNKLIGMVTVFDLMAKIASGSASIDSSVNNVLIKDFPKIGKDSTLGILTAMLKTNHYVVVVESLQPENEHSLAGILTHIDVLNYLIVADSYEH